MMAEARLLQLHPIDGRDDIEDFWLRNRDLVLQSAKIQTASEVNQEATKHVIAAAHSGKAEEIQIGTCCIYLLCTEENVASAWFNCLTMTARDSLTGVIQRLCELSHARWSKMTDQAKAGFLRLVKELAKLSYGVHSIINVLLRHIIGGDLTPQNIWLTEALLDVLIENRAWLERNQDTLQSAVFRYLRLIQERIISDHFGYPSYQQLVHKEVSFVIGTLRSKFAEIVPIGRDLVRLLIAVCHIPEFLHFWTDLVNNPGALMPNFNGIKELLKMRTSKKFIAMNVTPDMEMKIQYLLKNVVFGHQEYYQKWFMKSFLTSLSSQSLRPDLVRFVCTCVIPTNEILQSSVLPRWAFCGWVLSTCSTPQSISRARLALVWDWLLFKENRNGIMDIEPCLLLMHHSRKNNPMITYGILDFLLRLIKEFYEPLEEEIRRGIINSFRFILKKGVVNSIVPILIDTQKHLKALINTHLSEFLPADLRQPVEAPKPAAPFRKDQRKISESEMSEDAKFSDDEDGPVGDLEIKENLKEPMKPVTKSRPFDAPSPVDGQNRYTQLLEEVSRSLRPLEEDYSLEADISDVRTIDESLADTLERIDRCKDDDDEFCHELDNLMKEIGQFENGDFDSQIANPIAKCLARLCASCFEVVKLPPVKPTEDDFIELIGRPLYILFRHLCLGHDSDKKHNTDNLLNLTIALQQVDERTIHHLLYYISLQDLQNKDEKWYIYDMFCAQFGGSENTSEAIEIQLAINIQSLQEHDPDLLVYLVPWLFREYQQNTINNKDIIKMIVSVISPEGLMRLQARLFNGEFTMFSDQGIKSLLLDSLSWESFEQQAVWRLLLSHDNVSADSWINVLPSLSSKDHAEAVTAIQAHLRTIEPTEKIVKMLMLRDEEEFVVSTLFNWAKSTTHRQILVDSLIPNLMKAKGKTPRQSSRKNNRGGDSVPGPTISQVLAQLEGLRTYGEPGSYGFFKCTQPQKKKIIETRNCLFHFDAILATLIFLKSSCDPSDKEKYQELLNIFPDASSGESSEDDVKVLKSNIPPADKKKKSKDGKKKRSGKRTASEKSPGKVDRITIDSSSDESDGEPAKKKRS